ncbi:MAG TPA: hemolysin III family protein [Chloroflexia bacterium]|nr:hemolysin III family protein [Chloroflexia bacterium]
MSEMEEKIEQLKADLLNKVEQVKPLLRGWFHAGAAVGALALTIVLCCLCWGDWPRFVSMLVFGLSMTLLYTVSAVYHIGAWRGWWIRFWRSFDHANIFAMIAGTYTAICFNVLEGWLRISLLVLIWLLALVGILVTVFSGQLPRVVRTSLYIGMGWVGLLALPALLEALPLPAIVMILLGGILYTLGGLVYSKRWPDPFPRVFGFHEIFHLFVIAASAVFAVCVMLWALPYARN